MREFKLPDVGEGVAEGEIVRWLVEPGDAVEEDQPVAEVETDKALVEVPAPVDGTVREIRAEEGEIVPVGTVIIVFDEAGDAAGVEEPVEGAEGQTGGAEGAADAAEPDAVDSAPPEPEETHTEATAEAAESTRTFAPPHVRRLARELGVELSAVDGSGPGGRLTEADIRAAADDEEEVVEADAEPASAETAGSAPGGGDGQAPAEEVSGTEVSGATTVGEAADRERTLAAPATRRVARELDVDIDAVPAVEERDGEAFVTEEAVREYAETQQVAQAADAEAVAAGAAEGREERIPYRGVRRRIGDRMAESKYTAPHVTHHDTVVVKSLVDARERLKPRAEERGIRVTYLPFVAKAIVAALQEFPYMNAVLDEAAEEIVLKNEYHIGVAVATEHGLMVPVVRNVDEKGLLQIASEVAELAEKARERTISPDELRGSTFTITNFGSIGGEYATPIINYPEVAILGLGAIGERPVVEDGEVVARHTLPLSLSIDHRVVDGAVAAEFANRVMEYLNEPLLLLE